MLNQSKDRTSSSQADQIANQNIANVTPRPKVLSNNAADDTTTNQEGCSACSKFTLDSTTPQNKATNVARDVEIILKFSLELDAATVNEETISIFDDKASENISTKFNYAYQDEAKQVVISFKDPQEKFDPKSEIQVLISSGVLSKTGKELQQPYDFSFITK